MFTHKDPRRVLILGGGEGATLREVLRFESVDEAVMVDIDEELVGLCKKYLPEWSRGSFEDKRAKLVFQDARKYVEETSKKFDVVISDLTEPLEEGPSLKLFTKEFYQSVHRVLAEDGVFVVQSGPASPMYSDLLFSVTRTLKEMFPHVRPYSSFILSFQISWGFVLASKGRDPLEVEEAEIKERLKKGNFGDLTFFHPRIMRPLFVLPLYLERSMDRGRVLTDADPFIWTA